MTSTATPPAPDSASSLPARPGGDAMMNAVFSGAGSTALATNPTPDTPTAPALRRRRRLALLAVVAGLLLGGLVGLVLGPHSLSPGPRFSGDQLLAGDFRATLGDDRGLGSVEVARLRDGKVTYAGLAPDGTVPPTPQTPFELGSITKTMTGMLLADAVQRGEMRLDAPVSDYLPELAGTPAGAATLDQLATHHSGLPALPSDPPASSVLALWGNANPYAMSVETLLQLTRDTPLGTPGHFAYSNLGMSLLGHAEARAAGAADWPALARQRLLVPLGMTNTTFVTAADQIPAGTATPHKDNGWRAPHWYGAAFTPAGTSTYTTAEDMMKYARAVVEGQAPGLAALEPVADADEGRIGLAWMTSAGVRTDAHLAQRQHRRIPLHAGPGPGNRPSRPGAQQLHTLGRRFRAAARGGRIRRRVATHRTTRPWPRPDPPSSSVWCSWCPARSPCSEHGTGSLQSAVPSTPSPHWCCYAYTGRGPSYRRNCGQPWPGWSWPAS